MNLPIEFFVAPDGNDRWSGSTAHADVERKEGPFKTIGAAQRAMRALKTQTRGLPAPVNINLAAGTYFLDRTIVLTPYDSGSKNCPVTFRAMDKGSAILSGGRAITGWNPAGNGVWTVHLPTVQNGKWRFEQLFADGERVTHARLPHEGFYRMAGFTEANDHYAMRFRPGEIRRFHNYRDMQVAMLKSWDDCKLRVAEVDEDSSVVRFAGPTMPPQANGQPHPRRDEGPEPRYFLDNVLEGLDAPGRWYLDTQSGVLHYRPADGRDPNGATIIAPHLQCLLRCEARNPGRQPVSHIHFDGLRFEYCDWILPPEGHPGTQAQLVDPPALEFLGAWECELRHCRIAHVGGYGLGVGFGCRSMNITGNEICDTGSGGMKIGEVIDTDLIGTANERLPDAVETLQNKQHTITENHIHHCGRRFFGAVGMCITQSSDNLIARNRLHDLTYTGISVGYTWADIETRCKRNIVEYNEIGPVMQMMNDGAGIYLLGRSYGTIVRHNVVYGCRPAFTNNARGIYLDESASGIVVRNNVTYNTGDGAMLLHICWNNLVENNIFLEGKNSQLYFCFEKGADIGQGNQLRRNIFVYSGDESFLYQFWMKPTEKNFTLDENLFWWNGREPRVRINLDDKGEWLKEPIITTLKAMGLESKSVVADPQFVDLCGCDLRLRPQSPALRLGFEPFEVDLSGLRAYMCENPPAKLAAAPPPGGH